MNILIFETARDNGNRLTPVSLNERTYEGWRMLSCSVSVNPEKTFQKIKGFGGALTESSGYVLSKLSDTDRAKVISAYYGEKGIGYSFARTHMNSCDFSLDNWCCLPEKDETLESFSMEKTDRYITPLVKDVNQVLNNSGKSLNLIITPWSPSPWMKTNNDMNHGGKLLPEYKKLWADHFVRFIQELENRGIKTSYITIQNEPAACQTWDSCEWTAEEEGLFAVDYLGPAFEKAGLNHIKILVWDHNRDLLKERFTDTMKAAGDKSRYIAGAAFHWYSGDQYENLQYVSENYPDKDLIFTEGCIEGGPRNGAWFSGERYAHNILNDLNHGCTVWCDWNIALDMEGGPNHVGNNCDAPVLVDTEKDEIHFQSSYYAMGHFSKFIEPGSIRIDHNIQSYMTPATIDGRMGNTTEIATFKREDGKIILVITNRTEADMCYEVILNNEKQNIICPPRAMQTLVIG